MVENVNGSALLEQASQGLEPEKKFPCDRCGQGFSRKAILQDHLRVHDNKKPFFCEHRPCQMAFARKSDMRRHAAKHTGSGREFCKPCDKWFSRKDVYKDHVKSNICRQSEEPCQQRIVRPEPIVNQKAPLVLGSMEYPLFGDFPEMVASLYVASAPPTGYYRHTDHGDPFARPSTPTELDVFTMALESQPPNDNYTGGSASNHQAHLATSVSINFEEGSQAMDDSGESHSQSARRSVVENLPHTTSVETQRLRAEFVLGRKFPEQGVFGEYLPPDFRLQGGHAPYLRCRVCERKHYNFTELRKHLVQHIFDDDGRPRYTCNQCPASFQHRVELEGHYNAIMTLQSTSWPGGCNYCGKKFMGQNAHEEFGQHLQSVPNQAAGVVRGCHGTRLEQRLALRQRIFNQMADTDRLENSFPRESALASPVPRITSQNNGSWPIMDVSHSESRSH